MTLEEITKQIKACTPFVAATTGETRNDALRHIATAIEKRKEDIFHANGIDLARAEESGVSEATKKRLRFDSHKCEDVLAGIRQLIELPDPLHHRTLDRELDKGLTLIRETCPIGVIGVIFEARPDALIQIASLCVKSGNGAILKGGKETATTNEVLFSLIHEALVKAGLPKDMLGQVSSHEEVTALLACEQTVDLLIPRGSNAFVQYILTHTNIPVLGHADGVCHTYVDKDVDEAILLPILLDAKTQYTAACNATETVLIHRDRRDLVSVIADAFRKAGVTLYGTEEVEALTPVILTDEFHHEYGDMAVTLALVSDVDGAVVHINRYGSHHTDAVLTENEEVADRFTTLVDSANVYVNTSTRFADGFRYGFGAEVGISTGKIHARGPVGLEGLLSYKYKLIGHGHIVGDYASGKKTFHFRDR